MQLDMIDTLFDDDTMAAVEARSTATEAPADEPAPGMTFGQVITMHAVFPDTHKPMTADPFAADDFLEDLS